VTENTIAPRRRYVRAALRSVVATGLASIALAGLAPTAADATVLPIRMVDRLPFPAATEAITILDIRAQAAPAMAAETMGMLGVWQWDVTMTMQCRSIEATTVPVALLIPSSGDAWIDGVPVASRSVTLQRDPAMPDQTYPFAQLTELDCQPGNVFELRTRHSFETRVDSYGQRFLDFPALALSLFAENIGTASLFVELHDRPIALQTTLSDPTLYDEPDAAMSWYLRNWEPGLNFQVSWLSPWSALQMVADVESCPAPWQVVQATTSGDPNALQSLAAAYDDSTLRFCARLPEIIHGAPFEPGPVTTQLMEISMSRYLPSLAHETALYRPNPAWSMELLSEVEGLYRSALRSVSR
jgi:hypothetical protein